jgi:hypothetical protein
LACSAKSSKTDPTSKSSARPKNADHARAMRGPRDLCQGELKSELPTLSGLTKLMAFRPRIF